MICGPSNHDPVLCGPVSYPIDHDPVLCGPVDFMCRPRPSALWSEMICMDHDPVICGSSNHDPVALMVLEMTVNP